MDGLPSSIRDSLGEFTSAKELWLKIEEDYQGKVQGKQLEDKQETKPDPIHEKVDQALAKDEMNMIEESVNVEGRLKYIIKNSVRVPTHFPPSTYIEVIKKDLTKAKDHVVKLSQQHEQRTKEVKDLLRRLKAENTRLLVQLGEKDEEIDKLKDEESSQERIEGDLRTQRDESRRKEEILKD